MNSFLISKKLPFNRALRVLLATNSLVLLSGAMLGPIYALFVENIGGHLLDASFAGGIFALAAGVTVIISGKYSDKVKENELIVVFGYFIMGLSYFLYIFVNSIWSLLAVQVLIGFGAAVYSPAFDASYSNHLARTRAGRQWGAWESINYFTAAFGAIVGGALATFFGFDVLFIIMSLLCLGSAVYIFFLPRNII